MTSTEAVSRGQESMLTRLLADDYADNLAEGHRRHPTQFAGPFVTAHISLHHPGPFEYHFEDYLKTVFEFLLDPHCRRPLVPLPVRPDPAVLARDLKKLFSFDTKKINNELLLYELEDLRFEPINGQPAVVWRLELNREYLSFTLFSRLNFVREPDCLGISMMPGAVPGRVPSYRVPFDAESPRAPDRPGDPPPPSKFCEEVSRVLCREMGDHLEALFRPLLDDAIGPWTAQHSEQEGFRRPSIFARFAGPVVPWTAYGPGLRPLCVANADIWRAWRGLPTASEAQIRRNTGAGEAQRTDKCLDARPFFPRFRERSLESATPDVNWALTCTNTFLSRIWPGLEQHLLNGSQEDSVACYMQHGHAVYVSALGGRASPSDMSPSRYMILYDDPDGADLKGPASHSTNHREIDCTRRISRLVGRMHDLGVARLAALSGQATMKGFAQYLRSIENQLQDLNPPKVPAEHISARLHGLHDKLYKYLSEQRMPLNYSSNRTAYHLNVLDDLVADLNVVQIPGRQPYDRFIKRRFRAGLVYLTGVADRLQRVTSEMSRRLQMELLRDQNDHTRLAAQSADKIVDLQATADFFVRVLAFYYVPLVFYYVSENAAKVAKWLLTPVPEISLPPQLPTLPWMTAGWPASVSLQDVAEPILEGAPTVFFLLAFAMLYRNLPKGLIRDLVVFSADPKMGSPALRLARLFFPFHYRAGVAEGAVRWEKVRAEKIERERIAARGQAQPPPLVTD